MHDKIDRVKKNEPSPRSYKWALSCRNSDFTFRALKNKKSLSNTIRNDDDDDDDDDNNNNNNSGGGGGVNNNNNNNNYNNNYYYYYHHHHVKHG